MGPLSRSSRRSSQFLPASRSWLEASSSWRWWHLGAAAAIHGPNRCDPHGRRARPCRRRLLRSRLISGYGGHRDKPQTDQPLRPSRPSPGPCRRQGAGFEASSYSAVQASRSGPSPYMGPLHRGPRDFEPGLACVEELLRGGLRPAMAGVSISRRQTWAHLLRSSTVEPGLAWVLEELLRGGLIAGDGGIRSAAARHMTTLLRSSRPSSQALPASRSFFEAASSPAMAGISISRRQTYDHCCVLAALEPSSRRGRSGSPERRGYCAPRSASGAART